MNRACSGIFNILVGSLVLGLTACARLTSDTRTVADSPESSSIAANSQPTVGQEASAVLHNKVQVTFPAGGAALTQDANKQLDLAARLFRDANPVLMFTTGYSDRSGDEFSNLLLSARRARAVKLGLVARGIPSDRLLIQALGISDPADESDPQSAANRRVTITWRLL